MTGSGGHAGFVAPNVPPEISHNHLLSRLRIAENCPNSTGGDDEARTNKQTTHRECAADQKWNGGKH